MFQYAKDFRTGAAPLAVRRTGIGKTTAVVTGTAFAVVMTPVMLAYWAGLAAYLAARTAVEAVDYLGDTIIGTQRD